MAVTFPPFEEDAVLVPRNGNRLASAQTASPQPVHAIGRTGLKRWGGQISEEFLRELQPTRRAIEVYREISSNDPVAGAVLTGIELLAREVDWRTEPQGETPEDERAAELVEECRTGMAAPWEDTIAEILTMLVYGWSWHEITYAKYGDGTIRWAGWPIRAQDSLYQWRYAPDSDDLLAMVQNPPPDYGERVIPRAKSLHFRPGAHKDNPEGRSILRRCYLPWYFKNHIQRIEAIGIERDLAGYPVLYLPAKVMQAQTTEDQAAKTASEQMVQNIRRDDQEGALLPSTRDESGNLLYELKLLSTGGTRQFDTNAIIQRYDQRIAMTALADFILLGHEKVGSFALADSKTHLFAVALGTWLDAIAAEINTNAIPQLLALNGITLAKPPKLVHGDIETPNLTELGDYISKLSGAGVPLFPRYKLEAKLLEVANLPIETPEEWEARQIEVEEKAAEQAELEMQRLTQGGKERGDPDEG